MKRPSRRRRPLARLGLAAAAAALAAGCSSGHAATASPSKSPARLTVTSTLDGHGVLPQRIHWQAFLSTPAVHISKVDFLIDGRLGWEETRSPYFYGRDGNWLVTSFLTPGQHAFTVRVITADGHMAGSNTVKASVVAPAAPSAAVAGTWTRVVTPADVTKATTNEPPPAGHWRLQIGPTGWQLHDPEGGGQLFDVGYQRGSSLQMRPTIEYPPYPNSNSGGFCADTDRLWTWTYSVAGDGKSLTLRPVGHDPCGDRVAILAGTWTTVAR
jgi:hypothetical protein